MESWQLTLVILASVFVGAVIPILMLTAVALHRTGRTIAAVGQQLTGTLAQLAIISNRVEALSRGLEGGDTILADLMKSVGKLARGLERNMQIVNIASAVVASVGPTVAAYFKARCPPTVADGPDVPAGL